MKKTLFLFFVFMVFAMFGPAAQEPKPDAHIRKIVTTLKSGDKEAFIQLFPSFEQMKEFILLMMPEIKDAKEQLKFDSIINVQFTPEIFRTEMVKEFGDVFDNIISQGKDKGVVWSQIALDSFSNENISLENKAGIRSYTGRIYIHDNQGAYILPYNSIIWFAKQGMWLGVQFSSVLRPGEVEEPGTYRFEMDSTIAAPPDTSVFAPDTVMAAPRSSQVPKSKKPASKPTPKKRVPSKPKPSANLPKQ
jgi:hypothetical protein